MKKIIISCLLMVVSCFCFAQNKSDSLRIEKQFEQIIVSGDSVFALRDYQKAKIFYQKALKIKDDFYPTNKIQVCDINLKAEPTVLRADSCYNSKDYKCAVENYMDAKKISPYDEYIEKMLIQLCTIGYCGRSLNDWYNEKIMFGDKGMSTSMYITAIKFYKLASQLKPKEQYPKDKIAECEKLIKEKK